MDLLFIGALTVFSLAGLILGYFLRKAVAVREQDSIEAKAKNLIEEAKTKEKEIILSAKDKAFEISERIKKEDDERRKRLMRLEKRLEQREDIFDRKFRDLDTKQQKLIEQAEEIKRTRKHIEKIKERQVETLEKIASLSRERAKEILLELVEKNLQEKLAEKIKRFEEVEKDEADKKSKEIIALALQRYALSHASEGTSTTVSIPSDEMKGRIIGREGRNIKTIERLTGTEILVDDTPEAIVISGFNPIRRQIARLALEKLVGDGRIHPGRIEEAVEQAKKELASDIKESGESAVYDLGIADFDPKLVLLLGRLKYRSSYGQNVLKHSIEVANLSAVLAEELKADVNLAKKAGLLHDIGKAVDHEVEGTHIEIGKKIAKKFGLSEDIIHAIEAHHEDVEFKTVEAIIVHVADALSASRPGARKDTYENYIKRLEDLEEIANNFEGVEKSYAIQAGREIRVLVEPTKISDAEAVNLSHKIAEKIEQELQFPGEIKVNVIRETRAVDYAR